METFGESELTFTCSKSAIETPKKINMFKFINRDKQNGVFDAVVVSLLLTLIDFALFPVILWLIWTGKYRLGNELVIFNGSIRLRLMAKIPKIIFFKKLLALMSLFEEIIEIFLCFFLWFWGTDCLSGATYYQANEKYATYNFLLRKSCNDIKLFGLLNKSWDILQTSWWQETYVWVPFISLASN